MKTLLHLQFCKKRYSSTYLLNKQLFRSSDEGRILELSDLKYAYYFLSFRAPFNTHSVTNLFQKYKTYDISLELISDEVPYESFWEEIENEDEDT